MTTQCAKRCIHCAAQYNYYTSGGPWNQEATAQYCADCQAVIKAALKAVPRKYTKDLIEVQDPSLERVLAWEELSKQELDAHYALPENAGKLRFHRVCMGLFDMTDSTNQNKTGFVSGRDEHEGKLFTYSYWTKRGEPSVRYEAEVEVATGKHRPWRDFR